MIDKGVRVRKRLLDARDLVVLVVVVGGTPLLLFTLVLLSTPSTCHADSTIPLEPRAFEMTES